ncbi:hypothetical protein GCM10019016_006790 [Streptomyces prasinosporus]|uniref:Uncharacterized protein n=1 Tax=Streptomyces prasinosporus TaxID=68256 RepID=A0ABP6TFS2_9ACTN
MSEGYGNTGTGPEGAAGGTGATSDHAGIPFLRHVFRVSEFRRDALRTPRAVPDGWTSRT